MLYPGSAGSEEEVGQEAVPVCAHGHEVTRVMPDPVHDLGRRIPEGQSHLRPEPLRLELPLHLTKVVGVLGDVRWMSPVLS